MRRCEKCLMPDNLPGSDLAPPIFVLGAGPIIPYEAKGENALANNSVVWALTVAKRIAWWAWWRQGQHLRAVPPGKTLSPEGQAFIYTHGGSKDFSLRNARTSCEKLGVPLHEVSLPADKHKKAFLHYFRAWLAHPNAVSAGMTCVACKHLHILGSQIAARRGIPYVVWSSTPLEYSPFLASSTRGKTELTKGWHAPQRATDGQGSHSLPQICPGPAC